MQTLRLPILLQVHQLPFKVLGPSAVQIATREELTNGATQGSSGEAVTAQVFVLVFISSLVRQVGVQVPVD
jgi:hypothetical protein